MEDYRCNSNAYKRAKEEEKKALSAKKTPDKKIEKVISGTAKMQDKKSGKLRNLFTAEDASNIVSFAKNDVLIPSFKKAISDIIKTGIDMLLYPNGGAPKRNGSSGVPYVSYDKRYGSTSYSTPQPAQTRNNFSSVIVESRQEAEEVLDRMDELIATYGMVSVADLYQLVGIIGQHTDNKYGWYSIRSARITKCPEGWVIEMPRAQVID